MYAYNGGSTVHMTRKRHTTLNLDDELLQEAQEILCTTGISETIHCALREIVNRERRRAVLEYDFRGLTPESLEEMREDRGRVSSSA